MSEREESRLRLGIFTRNLPPRFCGISDHSLRLAAELRQEGHEIALFGSRGAPSPGVHIFDDDWSSGTLSRVRAQIEEMRLDHLILQFTPLMYAQHGRSIGALIEFWQGLGEVIETSLILHETYFRTWRRPKTLLTGTVEKRALLAMCRGAHHVFTALERLPSEMAHWTLSRPPVLLPISSNIPLANTAASALRDRHNIRHGSIILTLFGGGNNLKWSLKYVRSLARHLEQQGIAHDWLLLGGVPRAWLPQASSVIDPGYLPLPELSAYLAMTDVFLMPNWGGVSARRTTLMAAMEHGLPVVGTRGYMTESLLTKVEGVVLAEPNDIVGFCEAVVDLARDPKRRRRLGEANQIDFAENFTWKLIVQGLIATLQSSEEAA
jgi:hypothetical protein